MRLIILLVAGSVTGHPASALGAGEPRPDRKRTDRRNNPLDGYHKIWSGGVPVTGEKVESPPLGAGNEDTYRVTIEGVIDAGRHGLRFDGMHRTDPSNKFRLKHNHLHVEPGGLALVRSDRVNHVYLYGFGKGFDPEGKRVLVKFQRLAYSLRISPALLRESASSTLSVNVWKRGPPPRKKPKKSGWALWGVVGAAVILLTVLLLARGSGARRRGGS